MIRILQIDDIEHCNYAFRSYKEGCVNRADYKVVFEGELELGAKSTIGLLDEIFRIFNCSMTFEGHSLSVSDIVYLDGEYYYCDSFGWEKLKNF